MKHNFKLHSLYKTYWFTFKLDKMNIKVRPVSTLLIDLITNKNLIVLDIFPLE